MAIEETAVDYALEKMLECCKRAYRYPSRYISNEEKEIYFFENMHTLPEGYVEYVLKIGDVRYRDWVVRAAERYVVERDLLC